MTDCTEYMSIVPVSVYNPVPFLHSTFNWKSDIALIGHI